MPKRNYLFWGVVVYMVIKAITTLTGVNPYHSFWSNYERMEGFLTLVHFGILFVIMSGVFKTKQEWKWVFRAAVFGGLGVALVGLGQKLNLDFIIHSGVVKIDSTLGNSSYVAAYLIYNVFLLIYLFFQDKKWHWRIPYLAILLLDVVIIFFTASRGGMVGLLGGILILLLLTVFASPKETVRMGYKYLAIGFIVFMLILGTVFYINKDRDWVYKNHVLRKLTTISLQDKTIQDRFINAKIGFNGFRDRFFLGFGMENYYVPFNEYYNSRTSEPWFDRAHNIIFDQAVTGGIFGLLSYLFLLLVSIYYLFKRRARPCLPAGREHLTSFIFISMIIASFFANLFVFDNSSTYTMFFAVLAFVGFKIAGKKEEGDGELSKQKSNSIFVPVGVVVCLVLALYFFNIKPAIANRTSIEGYKYSKVNLEKSLEFFKKALDYNTFGNSEIALRIGDIALRNIQDADDKDKAKQAMTFAEEALLRAIELEPLNARHYIYLGGLYGSYFNKIDSSQENINKSIQYLKKGQELSPRRQEVHYTLGQVMSVIGRADESVKYFERAYSIKADVKSSYNLLLAYLYSGEAYKEKAEQLFEQVYSDTNYNENFFYHYRDKDIERILNVYYGRDDFDKIIRILDYIIDEHSGKPEHVKNIAKYHGKLAALYKEMGNKEKAREHVMKVQELDPEAMQEAEEFLNDL